MTHLAGEGQSHNNKIIVEFKVAEMLENVMYNIHCISLVYKIDLYVAVHTIGSNYFIHPKFSPIDTSRVSLWCEILS